MIGKYFMSWWNVVMRRKYMCLYAYCVLKQQYEYEMNDMWSVMQYEIGIRNEWMICEYVCIETLNTLLNNFEYS